MGLSSLGKFFQKPETGLLIIRAFAGFAILIHGVPKFLGGTATLEQVGGAMSLYGVHVVPLLWGFLAAATETVGGLLLILGLFFRPAAFLLFFTMLTAILSHSPQLELESLRGVALPGVLMAVFLGLMLTGPGAYSIAGGGSKGGSKSAPKAAKKE